MAHLRDQRVTFFPHVADPRTLVDWRGATGLSESRASMCEPSVATGLVAASCPRHDCPWLDSADAGEVGRCPACARPVCVTG